MILPSVLIDTRQKNYNIVSDIEIVYALIENEKTVNRIKQGDSVMRTKKFKRIIAVIVVVMLVAVMFCGCSALSEKYDGGVEDNAGFSTGEAPTGKLDNLTDSEQRKMIRNVDISAETKDFEKFLAAFETAVSDCGGYIQSQRIENNGYQDLRSGSITARIPSDKLDKFVGHVSKSANIRSRSSELEDITDQYIDVESRIKAMETEQVALLGMLEKATAMDDIMAIQKRLTEVRGELESYKARQKEYDNKVAYSTVSIYIDEVERENKTDPGFWSQAGNVISDSFKGVGVILRVLTLLFIGAFPYLLLVGVVTVMILIIVQIIRKFTRKRKAENNKINHQNVGSSAE